MKVNKIRFQANFCFEFVSRSEVEDTWKAYEATSPDEILVCRNNIPITAWTFKRLQGDWLNDEVKSSFFFFFLFSTYGALRIS